MDLYLLQGLVNGISIGFGYALVAIGFTLIFGVLRAVNFAHGEVYTVGAFAGLMLIVALSPPFLAVVFLAAAIGAACGWGLERIAFRPMRRARDEASLKSLALREATLMSSLAVGIVAREAIELVFGGEMQRIPEHWLINKPILLDPVIVTNGDLVILATAVLMLLGLQHLLLRTRIGLSIRAISDDMTGALAIGIDTDRIIVWTFALGSAFGAVAGILVGLYYGAIFPYMGFTPTLKAFVAMIMGGFSSIPGAVASALILGVAESLSVEVMPTRWVDGISYVFLLLTLLFFPRGLFGKGADRV